ncbi:phosphoribosyltransferase [Williamsia soli]|uniref:phosphoribosyltransferase n=1 Tax=Williamsia soli TaxID=364929 RepID=UPI001A9D2BB4|nr:phosphoribosyltransferase family protein [Williamsia soli]
MRLHRDHGERTFRNRDDAGRELARLLTRRHSELVRNPDVVVLGLARGGVPVAAQIATALRAPLDAFVIRKLGVPRREELAFGAVASGGEPLISDRTVRDFGVTADDVDAVIARERAELLRRESVYRQGRPPTPVDNRIVVLVDDGLATGSSMRVAVESIRRRHPQQIVVAVGTGPPGIDIREADEIVCATIPSDFWAVGQSYRDFAQVTDAEVQNLLTTE